MIGLGTIYAFLTGTIIGFLNRLQDAANQTLQVFSEFAAVTEGEIAWVAHQLGYGGSTNQLDTILAELAVINANLTALAAAVAALPDGTAPVILPTSPPTGYGGGDAADVWAYTLPLLAYSQGDLVAAAGYQAIVAGAHMRYELRSPDTHGWLISYDWGSSPNNYPHTGDLTDLNPATILITDVSLDAWLGREYPTLSYTLDASGYPTTGDTFDTAIYRHPFGVAEFAVYKAAKFGALATPILVPPVWPGLDLVTLLDAVPLAEQVAIDVPMDGCLVFIDSVPSRTGKYVFGEYLSYQNAGGIAFVSDEAVLETPQPLGLNGGNYTPKTMVQATGVRVRCNPAFTGTVQPWIRTT